MSAKKDAQNAEAGKTSDATATTDPETPKVDALPEAGASHDTHIEADFTDDEVDADVCRSLQCVVFCRFTLFR